MHIFYKHGLKLLQLNTFLWSPSVNGQLYINLSPIIQCEKETEVKTKTTVTTVSVALLVIFTPSFR